MISMGVMSLYDLLQGESVVLNCTASCWSVVSHMTNLFHLTLIGQKGHMTCLNCHCSFQLNCLHQVVLFSQKQDYSLILVYDFCSIGYKGPIFHKNGSVRGVNYPKIRGARGVSFMDNTPRDMDNIGNKCRLPFVYTL